jgi:hypothetical protein
MSRARNTAGFFMGAATRQKHQEGEWVGSASACICVDTPADTLILSLRALAGVAREANQGLPKEAGQSRIAESAGSKTESGLQNH